MFIATELYIGDFVGDFPKKLMTRMDGAPNITLVRNEDICNVCLELNIHISSLYDPIM